MKREEWHTSCDCNLSSPLLGGKGLNYISVVTHLIWWRSHSRARAVYTGHGRVPDSVYPMWSSVGHSFGLLWLVCMEGVLQYWLNIEEAPSHWARAKLTPGFSLISKIEHRCAEYNCPPRHYFSWPTHDSAFMQPHVHNHITLCM